MGLKIIIGLILLGLVLLGLAVWALVQYMNSKSDEDGVSILDDSTAAELAPIEDDTIAYEPLTITRREKLVAYLSRRRGKRIGQFVKKDRSGRVVIDMGHFTVRRKEHLVQRLAA